MTLQTSGTICISDLIAECGGTGCLTEYYRGGGLVPDTAENSGVPTSGTICLTDFYGCNCATPNGGGGGGGSVSINAYMPLYKVKYAKDMVYGDDLLILNSTRDGKRFGKVIRNRISTQKLLTLISESGIRLTCSDNTPLTLKDGSSINSTEALNNELPVQDESGFRWEKIVEVLDAGVGEVATIYCEDQCYGAGDEDGKYIWTHNLDDTKK